MSNISSDVADGLLSAMCAVDADAAQHLTATAAFAERVARTLGLDDEVVESCRLGALLHDIGLISVDKFILQYAGMLVDAEWDLVRQHPLQGAHLLLRIPSLEHIAPIVCAHHERVDGSGYPYALLGPMIPIEARIVAVADAFHTMTMPLRYRAAFTTTSAMKELVGNSGSQFDEDVVEAFGTMLNFRRRRLREA